MTDLRGRTLVEGSARGEVLVLDEPLSFWGGVDPADGRVVDGRHPQAGVSVSGRVLVMPRGRGSSSSSSVLAEAIRAGTAPVAIVLAEADGMVAVGAAVGAELYGRRVPVVVDRTAVEALVTGDVVEIRADADGGWIGRPDGGWGTAGPLGVGGEI